LSLPRSHIFGWFFEKFHFFCNLLPKNRTGLNPRGQKTFDKKTSINHTLYMQGKYKHVFRYLEKSLRALAQRRQKHLPNPASP
jgi:hypothetical protein